MSYCRLSDCVVVVLGWYSNMCWDLSTSVVGQRLWDRQHQHRRRTQSADSLRCHVTGAFPQSLLCIQHVQCGLDPATQVSSTPNFTVQRTWFHAGCSSHGCQFSAMLHLLLYTVKQHLIEAAPNWLVYADVFEHPSPRLASRRPIWSDMTSVDAVTQWREDWSSASVVNHTIVTDPTCTMWQPGFHLPCHTWSPMNRFCFHVMLTCTNGVSPNHLPVIVASDRPWTTLSTCAH